MPSHLDQQLNPSPARNEGKYRWLPVTMFAICLVLSIFWVVRNQIGIDFNERTKTTYGSPQSITIPTNPSELSNETSQTDAVCYKDPKLALNDFLGNLHTGLYEKAAQSYAGVGNPNQKVYPPNVSKEEKISIDAVSLENFCNGYGTCLRYEIVRSRSISPDMAIFTVRFFNDDGTYLTFMKPRSDEYGNAEKVKVGPDFEFRIVKLDSCYKNLDIPPVTP